jgi:hypothetical protein
MTMKMRMTMRTARVWQGIEIDAALNARLGSSASSD